jgi:hypothetical protein
LTMNSLSAAQWKARVSAGPDVESATGILLACEDHP